MSKENSITINLDYSFKVDGVKVDKISLRRPKVKDMLSVDSACESDAEKEINLFSNLSEISPSDLKELDMKDYSKLQKSYQDFLS